MRRTTLRTTCLALCLSGAAAQAQDLRPGVIGPDDRVRITERGPPWDAVGQVNVGGVHFCTGTLVAPDVVVSAAHCVTNEDGRPYGLRDIHYLAAVEGSSWKGHGTARCLKFLPGFGAPRPEGARPLRAGKRITAEGMKQDVAVIVLNEKLAVQPAGIAVNPPREIDLVHASYPADRRFALTGQFGCHRLAEGGMRPLWLVDCDTHPASSGGPVFVRSGGELKLAAIMVAAGAHTANVALPASEWAALAKDATCP